jgi:hypothetical protein
VRTDDDQAEIDRKSEARIAALVALFGDLTDREREEATGRLRERWCLACGGEQPNGWRCHCEDDE